MFTSHNQKTSKVAGRLQIKIVPLLSTQLTQVIIHPSNNFLDIHCLYTERKLPDLCDMLKQVIQPSSSAWASPMVLVPKKDGKLRFCVNYRKVNAVIKKDVYPLPKVDDIHVLDTLGKAKYFSTLDLASGYWQFEMDPATRDKSAFTTQCGLFRIPFGLCNSPATFQRLMQANLAGLEWKSCYVYIDDNLVFSKSWEEHLVQLQQVFDRLRQSGLTLKPVKCSFLRVFHF
jgi:hypothetical protein